MNSKQKNTILVVGILLLLVLSYNFGFSKTIQERREYNALLEEENFIEDIPKLLYTLSKQEKYLDSILGNMNFNSNSIENDLLRALNTSVKTNNVTMLDFNSAHYYSKDSLESLLTLPFKIEGSYNGILKTVYDIEHENNFGEIIHLFLEKKKNYSTKKEFLTATIFLQIME